MAHYIALIHKERDSHYGVSFPDVPGVIAAADSLDAALIEAAEALTGVSFPAPRSLDALQSDAAFAAMADQAVVAAVPLRTHIGEAA